MSKAKTPDVTITIGGKEAEAQRRQPVNRWRSTCSTCQLTGTGSKPSEAPSTPLCPRN
jgi:hypothetical protein